MTDHDRDMALTIGRLDRLISEMMLLADRIDYPAPPLGHRLDVADVQTLKHHAEDMIGAGQAILAKIEKRARK